VFWLNAPIGLLATALAVRLIPESEGAPERLDSAGVALVTARVVGIVWALVRADGLGWSNSEALAALLAGAVLLIGFVGWEWRRSRWFRSGCSIITRSELAMPRCS
jgi:hypothetical protein